MDLNKHKNQISFIVFLWVKMFYRGIWKSIAHQMKRSKRSILKIKHTYFLNGAPYGALRKILNLFSWIPTYVAAAKDI